MQEQPADARARLGFVVVYDDRREEAPRWIVTIDDEACARLCPAWAADWRRFDLLRAVLIKAGAPDWVEWSPLWTDPGQAGFTGPYADEWSPFEDNAPDAPPYPVVNVDGSTYKEESTQ